MRPRALSVIAVAVVVGCSTGGVGSSGSPASPTARPTPTLPSAPSPTARPPASARATPAPSSLPDTVIAAIQVGVGPGYLAEAFGSVWVGNHRGNSVSRIDPASNEVAATIDVPGEPTGISPGFGSIWTFTPLDRSIKRIDGASGALGDPIETDETGGSITGMAEAAGAMWHVGDSGVLMRIDPNGAAPTRTLDLGPACPGSLTVAAGSIWHVAQCGSATLTRIDPSGPKVVASIEVRAGSNSVWFGLDAVWVSSGDGWVTKVDPATNAVGASARAGSAAEQLRTGFGAVWIRVDDRTLVKVDPATLAVTRTDALPPAPIPGGGIAIGTDSVWVANFGAATVWRLRP